MVPKPSRRLLKTAERLSKMSLQEMEDFAKPLFIAAQKFLASQDAATRHIFVGGGMRHFYEAIWHLNNFEKKFPEENLVYYVVPKKMHYAEDRLPSVKSHFVERGLVDSMPRKYQLIDYKNLGRTTDVLQHAIKAINDKSEISVLTQQNSPDFSKAIWISDGLPKLYSKDEFGNIQCREPLQSLKEDTPAPGGNRAYLLLFKAALYKFVHDYKKSKEDLRHSPRNV